MSLHRAHTDVEEVQISSAVLNSDAQKAHHVELLEHSSYENSVRSGSAITTTNDKTSTLRKRLYVTFPACVNALFVDSWATELLAILLSIATFIAIIIVLREYDSHPPPRLPHGVTLNFVVSSLATISKSTLLLAVTSALGQFKWLWISSGQRRLQDLQVFDEASRGPLGAAKLLTSRIGLSWASIGAIVTTLCLIFDPFIQGLINNSERVVYRDDPGTFLKRIVDYPSIDLDNSTVDYPIINTINDAVFDSEPLQETQPRCPSGNCTWPIFTSLGFCSKCEDISQPLRNKSTYVDEQDSHGYTTRQYNYSLPEFNGQRLMTSDVDWLPDSMISFSLSLSTDYSHDLPAFWAIPVDWNGTTDTEYNFTDGTSIQSIAWIVFIRISTQPADLGAVLAANLCTLSFCAQKRNVSVSLTQPSSTILQTVYSTEVSYQFNSSEGEVQTTWLSLSGDDFNMTFPSQVNETDYSDTSFTLWQSNLLSLVSPLTGNLTEWFGFNIPQHPIATSNVMNALNASSNISMAMDNVATALTNYFRDSSNVTVTGQAGQVESYVDVSWRWITIPAVVIAGGTIFLLLAIFESKRRGVRIWKTSELALLFHGLEKPDQELIDLLQTSEMEHMASEITVKMTKTSGSGWILRRQDLPAKSE